MSRRTKVPIALASLWIFLALRISRRTLLTLNATKHAVVDFSTSAETSSLSVETTKTNIINKEFHSSQPTSDHGQYSHLQPHLKQLLEHIDENMDQTSQERYKCLRTDSNLRNSSTIDTPRNIVLYSNARKDRSGASIQDMLMAHSYAYHHNVTYAGACRGPATSEHYETHMHLLRATGLDELLPFQCPPDGANNEHCDTLHIKLYPKVYKSNKNIYWTPEWMQHIRQEISRKKQEISSARSFEMSDMHEGSMQVETPTQHHKDEKRPFTIVAHIRRGDVNPCDHAQRYLPNSHYHRLIKEAVVSTIRRTPTNPNEKKNDEIDYNSFRVIVFSETPSFEPLDDFNGTYAELPGKKKITFELIVNGDIAHVWNTIIDDADVIITSRSSFSFVAATLATATRGDDNIGVVNVGWDDILDKNPDGQHGSMQHYRGGHPPSSPTSPRVMYTNYNPTIPLDGWEVIYRTSIEKDLAKLQSEYCTNHPGSTNTTVMRTGGNGDDNVKLGRPHTHHGELKQSKAIGSSSSDAIPGEVREENHRDGSADANKKRRQSFLRRKFRL